MKIRNADETVSPRERLLAPELMRVVEIMTDLKALAADDTTQATMDHIEATGPVPATVTTDV